MIVRALEEALGSERVRSDEATRASRRRDEWVPSHLAEAEGTLAAPLCVVRPRTTAEVAIAVRTCNEQRCPIVPYGLGSGVCGAFRPGAQAVVLDLGDLAAIRAIDEGDLVATFEAGVRGSDAERALEDRGLTLGHFPQSLALSSVGGWVATRSTGQASTRNGGIEDMLLGLEVVLASGEVLVTNAAPRSSTGPRLGDLFVGSEGTLGVITAATLSLRRRPETKQCLALRPRTFEDGLALLRTIVQRDAAPAVVRLYDPVETARHFPEARGGEPLLLLVHEGPRAVVALESERCRTLAAEVPEDDPALGDAWLAKRFHAPSFAELVASGLTFDTIEVAAPWSSLASLYARVTRDVAAVPGVFVASAHASHVYRSGASLYFTFAGRAEGIPARRSLYEGAWRAAMTACLEAGATIAHHHGVGRVRTPWLARELGSSGLAVLRGVKRALDPNGILNPGVLLAEEGAP